MKTGLPLQTKHPGIHDALRIERLLKREEQGSGGRLEGRKQRIGPAKLRNLRNKIK